MKKILLWFCCMGILCSLYLPVKAEETFTFTDDLGRNVTLSKPQKVATLLGSFADLWVLSGGKVCAAPQDAFEDFSLPLTKDTVHLGTTKRLNFETLLLAEPDLIIASKNTPQHLKFMQNLEKVGIPVAYFDVTNFNDYLRVLKIFTTINHTPELYKTYGENLQREIQTTLKKYAHNNPPSVLMLRASSMSLRAKKNEGNVLGEMLLDFGVSNIADQNTALLETLSAESIYLKNPDKIFIVQVGNNKEGTEKIIQSFFQENPLLKSLSAVKNNEVYLMEQQLFNLKPNKNWATAYQILAERLYHTHENKD